MVVDNAAGEDPDFGEFMMNAVVVHPDYLKSNGETIRKFNRALHKASTWLLDHPAEEAVASMKVFLGRLDDKVILEGLQNTRLGIPRTPRISERAVALTEDFMLKIGALKSRIGYDKLVTNDYLPR
jgi:ABC-type nitrate/sulfonate/bicarbonate transport system substrate-binding protein